MAFLPLTSSYPNIRESWKEILTVAPGLAGAGPTSLPLRARLRQPQFPDRGSQKSLLARNACTSFPAWSS